MKKAAFPVLRTGGKVAAVALAPRPPTKVVDDLREAQLLSPAAASAFAAGSALDLSLRFGAAAIPGLSVVGTPDIVERVPNVLVHAPGLPGALPVPVADLVRLKCVLSFADPTNAEDAFGIVSRAASRSVSELGQAGAESFLVHLSRFAYRHHFLQVGTDRIIDAAETLHGRVRGTFAYHRPSGPGQSVRSFFDVTDVALGTFGGFRHGQKLITRYGVSVCVGVLAEATGAAGNPAVARDDDPPMPYSHRLGAPGATVQPELAALPTLSVGECKLSPSGPHECDAVLMPEMPGRYCHVGEGDGIDRTQWLAGGLFGAVPGAAHPEHRDLHVVGVRVFGAATAEELDLVVTEAGSGVHRRLTDVEIARNSTPRVVASL